MLARLADIYKPALRNMWAVQQNFEDCSTDLSEEYIIHSRNNTKGRNYLIDFRGTRDKRLKTTAEHQGQVQEQDIDN